jgi:hypothetical protein
MSRVSHEGGAKDDDSVSQSTNAGDGAAALGSLMSRVSQAPAKGGAADHDSVGQSTNTGFGGATALDALMSRVSWAPARVLEGALMLDMVVLLPWVL